MCRVAASLLVRPHPVVHRGGEKHRALRREQHGRKQIVRAAMYGARDEIRRGRRDRDALRRTREPNVRQCVARRKDVSVHGSPSDGLECYRPNELTRAPRHHHIDRGAALRQQARQQHGLVAGDPACDAEDYAATA